jgi:hypothetical protein
MNRVLSEEQRMQEGRRMFQIFCAKMLQQRVLGAYRGRIAAECEEQLILERGCGARKRRKRQRKRKKWIREGFEGRKKISCEAEYV